MFEIEIRLTPNLQPARAELPHAPRAFSCAGANPGHAATVTQLSAKPFGSACGSSTILHARSMRRETQTLPHLRSHPLDAYWAELELQDLPGRFVGLSLKPPTDFAWGREIHVIDPGGVCCTCGRRRTPRPVDEGRVPLGFPPLKVHAAGRACYTDK